ncbi:hypothetical protein E4N77_01570 [Treponema denticola]|nr:hypothetical protein E4N77_01570 [Treponema denticola]
MSCKMIINDYKNSAVIPDTSALLKNINIIDNLLSDFSCVIITQTIIDELNYQKDKKKNNEAWLAMQRIENLKDKIYIHNDRNFTGINDEKIILFAKKYSKEQRHNVYILHDDIGFSLKYEKSLLLRDYIGYQYIKKNDYNEIEKIDSLFLEDWNNYPAIENIDDYLSGGYTLLISCIRSKNILKYKKLEFLIKKCKANVNKTDNYKYFLTPLSHCIQVNDFKSFCRLLDNNADYNKGSVKETQKNYIKCRNEGNTPLMIACWHNRTKFVKRLCEYHDIGLNQQDSNGFTPLFKCAIKKNYDLYNYLLSLPRTDKYIRDRNNHCADWWLTHTNI